VEASQLWDRVQGVRVEQFTFPGDPMRIDYAYRRNGTRGFVQTLSVSRAPSEVRSLAYAAQHIRNKVDSSAFAALKDIQLVAENQRHRFVQEVLRDANIESVPLEGFAAWVAKLRPLLQ
jgi:hypothetical protein